MQNVTVLSVQILESINICTYCSNPSWNIGFKVITKVNRDISFCNMQNWYFCTSMRKLSSFANVTNIVHKDSSWKNRFITRIANYVKCLFFSWTKGQWKSHFGKSVKVRNWIFQRTRSGIWIEAIYFFWCGNAIMPSYLSSTCINMLTLPIGQVVPREKEQVFLFFDYAFANAYFGRL